MEPDHPRRATRDYRSVQRRLTAPSEDGNATVENVFIDHEEIEPEEKYIDKTPLYSQEKVMELKRLFKQLYELFWSCENDPKEFILSKKYDNVSKVTGISIWEKILLLIDRNNIDMHGYLFYALSRLISGDRGSSSTVMYSSGPVPAQLLSQVLIDDYSHYRKNLDQSERCRWESQKRAFDTECRLYDVDPEYVENTTPMQRRQFALLRKHSQFSPLFIYFHAYMNGLTSLCEKSRRNAVLQYSGHPAIFDDLFSQYDIDVDKFRKALLTIPNR